MRDHAGIEVLDLHKSFGAQAVHRGLSLDVRRGELVALVGGSGEGKSLLLKQIIGLVRPDRGEIRIHGENIVPLGERALMRVRRGVGMLFQGAALFDAMNVYENIAFPLRQHGERDEARIAARVAETLALVDLPGAERKMPAELSGGMQKRVGLARAIATEPQILLYDEPTTGLDPRTAHRIVDLIARLQRDLGVTSLMVTHDLATARTLSDRIVLLAEGRILAAGTWREMVDSDDPDVRRFLDSPQGSSPPPAGGETKG